MPISGDMYEFTKRNVDLAPDEHGVYALYHAKDTNEPTYIGRAAGLDVTIRGRLQDHQAGRDGACTEISKYYKREICANPVEREKELLREYQRNHGGNLPFCNDVYP